MASSSPAHMLSNPYLYLYTFGLATASSSVSVDPSYGAGDACGASSPAPWGRI